MSTSNKLTYYCYNTSLGKALIANTSNGICFVALAEEENEMLQELKLRFQDKELFHEENPLHLQVIDIINGKKPENAVRLDIRGTDFQKKVWNALLEIPYGETSTYSEIAQHIGMPKASRAVGNAVGRNSIAVLIPCHRVIRASGELGGFRWGIEIKKRILEQERSAN